MADARDLKSLGSNTIRVQVPSSAFVKTKEEVVCHIVRAEVAEVVIHADMAAVLADYIDMFIILPEEQNPSWQQKNQVRMD